MAFDSTLVHSNAVVFVPPGTYRLAQTCQFGTNTRSRATTARAGGSGRIEDNLPVDRGTGGIDVRVHWGSPEIGGISLQTTNSQTTGIVYSAPQ